MKTLVVLALLGLSQFASAGESPLKNQTLVCENSVGTIVVAGLSGVRIDVAPIPILQPYEVHTGYPVTADEEYSTGGIKCGFPPSGRPGHHVAPCQENESVVGSDRGNTILMTIHRDIDKTGTPTSGYYLHVAQVTTPRGDLPKTISEGAFYALTFLCTVK